MADPLRVLIVEDEVMLVMAMEDVLSDAGHIVVGTAASKDEAIAMADATKPDLVLLDLYLSDGSTGLAVAEHLRDAADTAVVFMTANERKVPADFVGAVGVIAKPFTQAGIAASIRYLAECVRRPPPRSEPPFEFTAGPGLARRLGLSR